MTSCRLPLMLLTAFVAYLCCAVLVRPVFADLESHGNGVATEGFADDIPAEIKELINDPALAGSITGLMIVDTKDGRVILQHDQGTRLIPASNRKLFTSAAALEILGDSYTIPTLIVADSSPNPAGVVDGNLYIKGGGDAVLSLDDLASFVSTLKAAGVKEITGNIVGDSTLFTDGPYPEGWGVDYLSDADSCAGSERRHCWRRGGRRIECRLNSAGDIDPSDALYTNCRHCDNGGGGWSHQYPGAAALRQK